MDISNYLNTAKDKINNKPLKTLILAILAGVFISLAAMMRMGPTIGGTHTKTKQPSMDICTTG